MTEEDLINLKFTKIIVPDSESQNGYDYYYYRKEIEEGLSFISNGNDEATNNKWYVINPDWPNAKINDKESIINLENMVQGWVINH